MFLIITSKRIKLENRAKSQIVENPFRFYSLNSFKKLVYI